MQYAETENVLFGDQDINFKLGAVIFAIFLTRVVMNTLFPASGYQIALAICKDCVVKYYETVDNYTKTSRHLRDFEVRPSDNFVCQFS